MSPKKSAEKPVPGEVAGGARKAVRSTAASGRKSSASTGFTEEERAAMQERTRELAAERQRGPRSGKKPDGEAEVLAKIAALPAADRTMAERLHAIISASAPGLSPKTWYGMPAYARDGKVVCFFQGAGKFRTRYATLGFSDQAKLDDGAMWPTSFALSELSPAVEARIAELVKRAAG
jgi:uncharacterized protein YdhG (YjbR/CyaY superfamily)